MSSHESGEEETISNIANFLESTKPKKSIPVNFNPSKVTIEPAVDATPGDTNKSDLVKPVYVGKHKLPISVNAVSLRPIGGTVAAPSISKGQISKKFSGFSGISISKLPSSGRGEDQSMTSSSSSISMSSTKPDVTRPRLPSGISLTSSSQMSIKPSLPSGTSVTIEKQEEASSKDSNKGTVEKSKVPNSVSVSNMETPKTSSNSATVTKQEDANNDTEVKQPAFSVGSKLSNSVSINKMEHSNEMKPSRNIFENPTDTVYSGSVAVKDLAKLTNLLNTDASLSHLVLKFMSSDAIRNLCDGVTALVLSGEQTCSDVDTLSLYVSVVNINKMEENLESLNASEYLPLTNLSCRVSYCSNLLKLVYKEPNLKGFISNKVGEEELLKFEELVNHHSSRNMIFMKDDIEQVVILYHKFRNIALQYVLTKLRNVYKKMKPMFHSLEVPDEEFKICVDRLANLVDAEWNEEVKISEESGYDFNFLITIMKYVKKSKEKPSSIAPKLPSSQISITPANCPNETQASPTVPVSITQSNKETKNLSSIPPEKTITASPNPAQQSSPSIVNSPNRPEVTKPISNVSVESLHDLKTVLETSQEPQNRVIKGVGQQAFKEFCNLVSTLQDKSLVIEDINIRTLYFTILNFSKFAVNPEMKKYEPLSNFALKLQSFMDLRNLFRKDVNIRKIVAEKLDPEEVDKFEEHVDKLAESQKDFVLVNQEENIIGYHRVRNCLIDNVMTRLRVIHTKISSFDASSAPEIFNDSVKMLTSLMNTHYNGQVLMMEKIRFNFDFLSTILDYLRVMTPSQEEVNIKNMKQLQQLDPVQAMINTLSKDVSDTAVLQSIDTILSQKLCRAYINTMKSVSDTSNLTTVQKRGIYSLKNAILLYRSNFKMEDAPLTNVSLEVSKILSLSRFITRDAAIKAAINEKHGAVACKELEALIKAHTERGDEFVTKFVEKNIKLYHSLRNTALEKLLKQITVVHSKVLSRVDIPESVKKSSHYDAAIKRLEDIVTAETVSRMLLIEEQKFDFDFLSTILLVWRTETARQAEAAKEAAAKAAREAADKAAKEAQEAAPKPTEVNNVRPQAPKGTPTAQIPTTIVVKKPTATTPNQNIPTSKDNEEDVDDPMPVNDIIDLDDDKSTRSMPRAPTVPAHSNRRSWPSNTRSVASLGTSRYSRPVATVTPMTPMTKAVNNMNSQPEKYKQSMAPNVGVNKIATQSNPMQIIDGQGELPIRTKCTMCNDRTSENMLQLIHHYSVVHFRDEIEKYIKNETCLSCSKKFDDKNDLIRHIGLVHGVVHLQLTKTERWICDFCKKEFLTEEFLKKHLIKGHFEKKFESLFMAMSENNEILCQFCDQTFTFKKNLFCHIGIDHNKLEELLPNNKKDDVDNIKCRHCDLETGLISLKSHYISTHYRDTFHKYCQELDLLEDDNSCKYCLVEYSEKGGLFEHYGVEHNLIYRLIANFQGKNVSAVFKDSQSLKSLAELAEMKSSKQEELDPLMTETVFVDASQAVSSPVKPVLKLVSPSKLKVQQKVTEKNVTITQNKTSNIDKTVASKPAPTSCNKPKSIKVLTKLPKSPLFEDYKSFCKNMTGNSDVKTILQTNFSKFHPEVFEQFLEKHCKSKSNVETLDEMLTLFSETYPSHQVKSLPFILKYLALKEFMKYCENLKTTPENCNPMHIVIFFSQLLAKPNINVKDLEWLVLRISASHKKVDGKTLVSDKKICDFFEAIGIKLTDPNNVEEVEKELEEAPKITETPIPDQKEKYVNKGSPSGIKRKQMDEELLKEQSEHPQSSKVSRLSSVTKDRTAVGQEVNSVPQVTVEDEDISIVDEANANVKVEKSEEYSKSLTLNEEPEVIDLDDDEDIEYKYFCMECEGCTGSKCDHTKHPRVPLPFDMRSHLKSTGHVSVRYKLIIIIIVLRY